MIALRLSMILAAALAVAVPLVSGSAAASAQNRTTGQDHLLTAGTVASTCPSNPIPGNQCQEFWFYAAVGTERRDGVAQQVNRIGVDVLSLEWTTDAYDGIPGWVQTGLEHGDATGGASVASNLASATLLLVNLPMWVTGADGSTSPSAQNLTASIGIRTTGGRQTLGFKENDRGSPWGTTTIGHFERWRPAEATATINGHRVDTTTDLTYIGSYVGRFDVRPTPPGQGNASAGFLHAKQPGTTSSIFESAYAEGDFGTLQIDQWTVVGEPELTQTSVSVNGTWTDMTGNPGLQFTVATDLSGATATLPLPRGETYSIIWSQAGQTQAERSYYRDWSTSAGRRFQQQVRDVSQQRTQTVETTVNGSRYVGPGEVVLRQIDTFSRPIPTH
jgi:hypothetical protein